MASACALTSAGGKFENVLDADRHEHAVDRLTRAVGAQHVEEGEPALAIDFRVRILRRITPRRVDQHRFVGEPPVAIARAADALHRSRRGCRWRAEISGRN